MKRKTIKVYKIETGVIDKVDGDCKNWSAYRLIACDAEEAIKIAKLKFVDVKIGEYIESVVMICSLDE